MAHIKRKTAVSLGRETTYKTESTQLVAMGVQSLTVDIQKTTIKNDQAYGRIEQTRNSKIGARNAQVTLTGIVEASFWGQFQMAALGAIDTTADDPEAGANTHDFSVANNNQHAGYSILFKDDVQNKAVLGARLVSLKTSIVAGEYVTYTAVFMGHSPVTTTTTPGFLDSHLFCAAEAQVKLAAVGAAFSGSAIELSTLDVDIAKNAEVHNAFGSVDPNKVINKQFAVTGTATLLFEDEDQYDQFMNHSKLGMEILITGDTNLSGLSTPPSFKYNIYQLAFDGWNNNAGNDEKVEQTITFSAEFENDTANAKITSQLINDVAGSAY